MSLRELVVLGTASQVPTRHRNHNGYLLRWDDHGFLFDPGEGTQRQFVHAGVAMSAVTRIFITHFHGDHSLGLASVVQRLSLDGVSHPVEVFYPETGQVYYERLIGCSIYYKNVELVPRPLPLTGGVVADDGTFTIEAWPLEHAVDAIGYRICERSRPSFIQERLRAAGVAGPMVGELQRTGRIEHEGRTITVEQMSAIRPGSVFGFLMDTRRSAACGDVARDADLLVSEATFLESERDAAQQYFHLTATDAAEIAREAGVRRLLLTHFSQRYTELEPFLDEASAIFPNVAIAHDLDRYPFPRRELVPRPEQE